jgi:5-formyltetrahydrofolate cyclo-ligase
MLNKEALRHLYRSKREVLSPKDLEDASAQIMAHVISNNLVKKGLLMLFYDSAAHAELPMEKWFDAFKRHPICVPKVINTDGEMEAVIWQKGMPIIPNKWGIPEPLGTDYITPKNIVTIVVPLLCFDHNGQRVGYGKGYYDRFLSRCTPTCKTIGVSFFDPIEKITGTEITDVPLDVVVTPKGIYTF